MTLQEMQNAVCGKMPELFFKSHNMWRWKERPGGNEFNWEINWPTEGLQVCHEAEKLLKPTWPLIKDSLWEKYVMILANKICMNPVSHDVHATYEQRLEALCRFWWPEKWKD